MPLSLKFSIWRLVIFPGGPPPSIVTAMSLYDRVRDGNGWFPHAWPPEILMSHLLRITRPFCASHTQSCIELLIIISFIVS